MLGIWARTLGIRVRVLRVGRRVWGLREWMSVWVLEVCILMMDKSVGRRIRGIGKLLRVSSIVVRRRMLTLLVRIVILREQARIDRAVVPVGRLSKRVFWSRLFTILKSTSTISPVRDKIVEGAITSGGRAGTGRADGPASGWPFSPSSEFGGIQTTVPSCPPIACFSIFLFRRFVVAYIRCRPRHASHIF